MIVLPWRKSPSPGCFKSRTNHPSTARGEFLAHQLEITKRGYELMVGAEPEFMLLKRSPDGSCAPWDALDNAPKPCYDMRALNRNLTS